MLRLVSVSDIKEGEEILTTYNGGEFGADNAKTADRRKYLMEHFGFHCMCVVCVEGEEKL